MRIVDLARDLVAELDPGVDITIEYTGLRCGRSSTRCWWGPPTDSPAILTRE